jgi:hypothetical protein
MNNILRCILYFILFQSSKCKDNLRGSRNILDVVKHSLDVTDKPTMKPTTRYHTRRHTRCCRTRGPTATPI